MEQLQYLYFKYRQIIINAVLFCAIIVAFLNKTETIRSLSFGLASGIALITLGESINRLIRNDTNTAS